jgi:hypothetical protein
METATERQQDKGAKPLFILAGFTQTAAIRTYEFERMLEGKRIYCTVEVNLALIPGYGIRIQDLPQLCRDLLQQRAESDGTRVLVFTEQEMRGHAERRAAARDEAESRKKTPRRLANTDPNTGWRPTFR